MKNIGNNAAQAFTGKWRLLPDPDNTGKQKRWFNAIPGKARPAPVPGIIQEVFPDYHGIAWYWFKFKTMLNAGKNDRILLQFGAVDYLAEVWMNGKAIGGHEGGETPFALDVTKAIKRDHENLLAVRVLNPTHERIDGIVLNETPHRHKLLPFSPGAFYNHGGIQAPVELLSVPAMRITDIHVVPDLDASVLRVTVTVRNDTGKTIEGALGISIAPDKTSDVLITAALDARWTCGEYARVLTLPVTRPHQWNLDDPFLYRVQVRLTAEGMGGNGCHEKSVRCGFRDFRVKSGWFMLNGRRLFLKSTHTVNHFPIGQVVPRNPDFMRRDLIYAKACGFNTIRFIAGMAWPEQLDFCDELGLMVQEETMAGWWMSDSPRMAERYDRSMREMIMRDRNHACITIWVMLNETGDGAVFRHAEKALKLVRGLDQARLVLLNSGRWDAQPMIGSISNPGSSVWETQWGAEGSRKKLAPIPPDKNPQAGGFQGAGDAHVYPRVPQTADTKAFIRHLGHGLKPVLLSEYGIGSLMNVIDESRKYEETDCSPDVPDAARIKKMADQFKADWKRFGFEGLYPFAGDMLRDSQRLHARYRRLGFDLVRSNPNLCGLNITGMLDHGITGEGLWTFWREWKPGIADVLRDGWAPLRWCLFVTPSHGYAGRAMEIEAVLANEGVLMPGKYPVRFRITGPNGLVWEKRMNALIPKSKESQHGPMAVPVLRTKVSLDGPSGEYTFAAHLEKGGVPAGDRMSFRLTSEHELPRMNDKVTVWGIDRKVVSWLEAHGVTCRSFGDAPVKKADVILVGQPSDVTRSTWTKLLSRIERGGSAVFLKPQVFRQGEDSTFRLPLANKGICTFFNDWLYHKECVARQHPIFAGLQTGGILDWDYYDQIISHDMFQGQKAPDETICAAFAAGYNSAAIKDDGYVSGIMMGRYAQGAGSFVVNTLNILDHVDCHPAADRLLLNLVADALSRIV